MRLNTGTVWGFTSRFTLAELGHKIIVSQVGLIERGQILIIAHAAGSVGLVTSHDLDYILDSLCRLKTLYSLLDRNGLGRQNTFGLDVTR